MNESSISLRTVEVPLFYFDIRASYIHHELFPALEYRYPELCRFFFMVKS